MNVGRLRQRVTVQRRVDAPDSYGDTPPSWEDAGNRWAEIQPLTGREAVIGAQTESLVSHRVRMWYWSEVTPSHRLKFGSRILNIESVRNINEYGAFMELLCIEETD